MGIIHKYVRDGSRTIVLAIDDPRLGMEEIVRIISSISEYTKVFKLGLPLIVHYGLRNISKLTNEFSDLYFIATAKLLNAVLLTNDRKMADMARSVGVKAFYLVEEADEFFKLAEVSG